MKKHKESVSQKGGDVPALPFRKERKRKEHATNAPLISSRSDGESEEKGKGKRNDTPKIKKKREASAGHFD